MHLKVINNQWVADQYSKRVNDNLHAAAGTIKRIQSIQKKKVMDCTDKGKIIDLYV